MDNFKPDILCLQETKCSQSKLPEELKVPGYHSFFSSGDTEGYAGTALYSKDKPKDVKFGMGNNIKIFVSFYNKLFYQETSVQIRIRIRSLC